MDTQKRILVCGENEVLLTTVMAELSKKRDIVDINACVLPSILRVAVSRRTDMNQIVLVPNMDQTHGAATYHVLEVKERHISLEQLANVL